MKIQYCSDLHLEFPANKKYLKANPIKPEGEILLLAGEYHSICGDRKEKTPSSIFFPTALSIRIGFLAIMNTIGQTSQKEQERFMKRSETTYRY